MLMVGIHRSFKRLGLDYIVAFACLTVSIATAGFFYFGNQSASASQKQVVLQTRDGITSSMTSARTVGDFLIESGIPFSDGDLIVPPPSTPVKPGIVVSYTPSVTVFVADAGNPPVKFDFPGTTVCELLDVYGYRLSPLDRVEPAPSTPLEDGMEIEITRVQVLDVTKERKIDPPLIIEADPSLPRGRMDEVQSGTPGLAEEVTRIYFRNGTETLRHELTTRTLIPPTERIARVGTRSIPSPVSRDGTGSRNVINMIATGYDPGPRSCGPFADGRTATGRLAGRGVCAVDPNVIPLGTELWIEGYGYAVAADTGSAIKGYRIDLCFDTYEEALSYGRRRVLVYIIE